MAGRKAASNRCAIASRVMAASIGAYGVCYSWVAMLARVLPMEKVDAVIVATNAAFLLFVAIILRSFAIRSVTRLWIEIATATALPVVIMAGGVA